MFLALCPLYSPIFSDLREFNPESWALIPAFWRSGDCSSKRLGKLNLRWHVLGLCPRQSAQPTAVLPGEDDDLALLLTQFIVTYCDKWPDIFSLGSAFLTFQKHIISFMSIQFSLQSPFTSIGIIFFLLWGRAGPFMPVMLRENNARRVF